MKIKTSELTGPALVWAMCQAEGHSVRAVVVDGVPQVWSVEDIGGRPTTDRDGKPRFLQDGTVPVSLFGCPVEFGPERVGELLGEHGISVVQSFEGSAIEGSWAMPTGWAAYRHTRGGPISPPRSYGKSAHVAVFRCLIASKLGDEVEVPDCLVGAPS